MAICSKRIVVYPLVWAQPENRSLRLVSPAVVGGACKRDSWTCPSRAVSRIVTWWLAPATISATSLLLATQDKAYFAYLRGIAKVIVSIPQKDPTTNPKDGKTSHGSS